MKKTLQFVGCALAVLVGPGCAYFKPTPRLQAAPPAEFVNEDLPVPEEFTIDKQASWRHERSEYRRLKLIFHRDEYLGQDRVAEFVKAAYATHGWKVDFQYGLEGYKFILSKASEECRIHVYEDYGSRFTEMTLEVEPRTTPDGEAVARPAATLAAHEPAAPAPLADAR